MPRPGGGGDPEILVQVKLSKRELMHSLGMSWTHSGAHDVIRKPQTREREQSKSAEELNPERVLK